MTLRIGTLMAAMTFSVTVGLATVTAQDRSTPATAPAQKPGPSGGLGQGIKVHGRWTIEVRNADGSVVSRNEFDNALTGSGGFSLTGLLARLYVRIRDWQIDLEGPGICLGGCSILESHGAGDPPIGTLSARIPPGEGRLNLIGTLRVASPGTIQTVTSSVYVCADAGCTNVTALPFTAHTLSSPIEVVAGQIVQVKVVFSFS